MENEWKVRKSSLLIGVVMVFILVLSAFLAIAYKPLFSIKEYELNAAQYTKSLSDEQILNLIQNAMGKIPAEKRQVLASFSEDEMLAVARGTGEGQNIVKGFTTVQEDAASAVIKEIIYDDNNRALMSGSKLPRRTERCPPLTGGCTSGEWTCIDGNAVNPYSCEFQCGTGGTWGPGTFCQGPIGCSGNRCSGDRETVV